MASKEELDECYMSVAEAHAKLSKAKRLAVGAAIVTQNFTILGGVNGRCPSGSNSLEYEENGKLVSYEHVIHAELSCLLKAAREGVSVVGGTLYTTTSCCMRCSEMIAAAGISRVVYKDTYRLTDGIENLKKLGVIVEKYETLQ